MTVWIFKERDIFGGENVGIQTFHKICSLQFFEILCEEMHSKGSKSYFFSFFRTARILPKEPFTGHFRVQNCHFSYFLFHCFNFPDSLELKTWVHCYFIHVFLCATSFQYLVFIVYFNYALNILIEKKNKREIQMSRECLPTIDIAYMCSWN